MNQKKRLNPKKVMAITSILVIVLLVVFSERLLPAYANLSNPQITVTVTTLNVREAASISSKIIGKVHRGDTFELIQAKNQWDQIKMSDNQLGWVNHAYVASNTTTEGSVNAIVLNVREQPSLNSNVIGKLKSGAKINILEEQSGWAKIKSASRIHGWVYSYYITKQTPNSQPVAAPAVGTSSISINKDLPQTDGTTHPSDGQTTRLNGDNTESLKGKTIVLDAGHGGVDAGTTSISGTREKDLALATAKVVEQKLKNAGANIMLTRTDDTFISLQQRSNISNDVHADAFISFHYNWSSNPSVNGLTDFYYNESRDRTLASNILNEVVKTTGMTNIGTRFDDLYVLRNNSRPSVLIELGFLSNKQDEATAESLSYNEDVAQGIYMGLLDYFSKKTSPR